jgi:hypothetical protein
VDVAVLLVLGAGFSGYGHTALATRHKAAKYLRFCLGDLWVAESARRERSGVGVSGEIGSSEIVYQSHQKDLAEQGLFI